MIRYLAGAPRISNLVPVLGFAGFAGAEGFADIIDVTDTATGIPPAGKAGRQRYMYDRKDNSRISFKEHKRSKFKNAAMESSVRGPYRQGRSRAAQPSTRNPKHISLHILPLVISFITQQI